MLKNLNGTKKGKLILLDPLTTPQLFETASVTCLSFYLYNFYMFILEVNF